MAQNLSAMADAGFSLLVPALRRGRTTIRSRDFVASYRLRCCSRSPARGREVDRPEPALWWRQRQLVYRRGHVLHHEAWTLENARRRAALPQVPGPAYGRRVLVLRLDAPAAAA